MSRLFFCGLLAWVILFSYDPVWADDAEDKAVTFVEKLGGSVTRNEDAPGKPVTTVSLAQTKVTDAGLKELAGFKSLTHLSLHTTFLPNLSRSPTPSSGFAEETMELLMIQVIFSALGTNLAADLATLAAAQSNLNSARGRWKTPAKEIW